MILAPNTADFTPRFHVVGVYVRLFDRILLLLRHPHKPEGNTWCIPGGKIDQGEDAIRAAVRELSEETGIVVSEEDLRYCNTYLVRYADYDFRYSTFEIQIDAKLPISRRAEEHSGHGWFTPEKALTMALIESEDECIRDHFRLLPTPT